MQNPVERPCPECGGQRIACTPSPEVTYSFPTAIVQKKFWAVICTNCGYTSFYADELAKFAKAMEKNPAEVQKGLQQNAQKLTDAQNWRNKK
jgi:predicted nucleic-acid-binding Zn-ribbon protein